MTQTLHVLLEERSYDIHIGPDVWDQLPHFLAEGGYGGRLVVVADERVYRIYGNRIIEVLAGSGLTVFVHEVPEGEQSKSFFEIERLCREMARLGLERGSLIVALGGGVVGDLAGLASSLYLRGIDLIQLPTSLLAMVDSSVGGKTGINIAEGKNLVGTFHQPRAVFADTTVLKTLEERDWYSGMAEVVKIALTLDPELFRYLEEIEDLGPSGGIDTVRVINAVCARKAEVVNEDERESGHRRVLNFGHTLAHALEASLGYGVLKHGEAVALGMQGALVLSKDRVGLPVDQYSRAMAVVGRIPVPEVTVPADLDGYLTRDKKSVRGKVTVVLISNIGRAEMASLENPGELTGALMEAIGD